MLFSAVLVEAEGWFFEAQNTVKMQYGSKIPEQDGARQFWHMQRELQREYAG